MASPQRFLCRVVGLSDELRPLQKWWKIPFAFWFVEIRSEGNCKQSLDLVNGSIITLIFYGNRDTRTVAESILANSHQREPVCQLLEDSKNSIYETVQELRRKAEMGFDKFTSLQKTYNVFPQGIELPKHNYTFHVDVSKRQGVIEFPTGTLKV